MYAQVIVPLPLGALTYSLPDGGETFAPGDAVEVKLRNKTMSGVVLELLKDVPGKKEFAVKPLLGRSFSLPSLSEEYLDLIRWVADYYHYPIGEVLSTALPPNPEIKKKEIFRATPAGLAALKENSIRGPAQKAAMQLVAGVADGISNPESGTRSALRSLIEKGLVERLQVVPPQQAPIELPANAGANFLNLNEDQAAALAPIRETIDQDRHQTFLLQGITGSGKTEVYLRAAEHALKKNKSVLFIVPEIALTPQLIERFRRKIGVPTAVLHSSMSAGERSRQWHLLNSGEVRACIGVRSSALSPIKNLGLIVVDEEHDGAFKQEDHLRYNARDVAVLRASRSRCAVILGSATPSLETYHHARQGKYSHLLLPNRVTNHSLPEVMIVDQSKQRRGLLITDPLAREITNTIASKQQAMLLLNRRGFSSFVICTTCGHVPLCPNCSVSLTNYKDAARLKCHYCGHSEKVEKSCKACHGEEMQHGTEGTEALEAEVKQRFPHARTIRVDRESMSRKGSLESALEKIGAGEVDIVVGTQMIAKGHDFPNITLVGVINADSSLHIPDFRSTERSFQLFTQMAGRAGRGNLSGKVFIQTYNPHHPSISFAVNHDYAGFAEHELRLRHEFAYPPFSRMARLLLSSTNPRQAETGAEDLARFLERGQERLPGLQVLGPAPAALSKIQNRYRWNLLLKSKSIKEIQHALSRIEAFARERFDSKVMLHIDVDPLSLM